MPPPAVRKIFISHSSRDHEIVERDIVAPLTAAGLDTWYAKRDIPLADGFNEQIVRELKSSDWFVVALSSHAVDSRWVKGEVKLAYQHLPDRVLPLLLESCDVATCDLRLTNVQAVILGEDRAAVIEAMLRRFSEQPDASDAGKQQLVDSLRLAREHPELGSVPTAFAALGNADQAVVDRARQAIRAFGWQRIGKTVEELAAARDEASLTPVLEGLGRIEANQEVAEALERAIDSLGGQLRLRAIALLERKRVSLEFDTLRRALAAREFPYELTQVLGQGLFAASYKARHRISGLDVVMRVLRAQLFARREVRDAFRQLLGDSMHYRHERLVSTREVGTLRDERLLWCVRDYVDGVTLQEALTKQRRFTPQQSLEVIAQLADVLAAVHRRKRAHGGIKPTNVFVAGEHDVVLGDPSLPMHGLPMDLPTLSYEYRYVAPESFDPTNTIGPAADVYSLACLAYELLCGRTPFVDSSPVQLLTLHRMSTPPRASALGCPFGDTLDDLFASMLDKQAERRPSLARIREQVQAAARARRVDAAPVVLMQDATRAALASEYSMVAIAGADLPEGTIAMSRSHPAAAAAPAPAPAPAETRNLDATLAPPSPATPPPPARIRLESAPKIPGVEITAIIGGGGMGSVYRGRQLSLDREVAVKVLQAELANPEFLARFMLEAKSLAQLKHPNIVSVFEAGTAPATGEAYLVMEYVDGTTIDRVVKSKGPLSISEASGVACDVALALQYAATSGLVHRDVKPSNVMLTVDGRVVLLDFGIARSTRASEANLTMSGALIGTPAYMAPEQWNGSNVDFRSDLYGLGCTLFFMLVGKPPFAGTILELMRQHDAAARPSARAQRRDVPKRLDAICTAMMARSPGDRPQTVAEVVKVLETTRRA